MQKKIKVPDELRSEIALAPKEELVAVAQRRQKLFIGIPREKQFQEKRIALTPESVEILTANGHRVIIESKAGEGAHLGDAVYSEAGAEIARDLEEVLKASMILKAAPPSVEEIKLLYGNQVIISPIHLPTLEKSYLETLLSKKVTALAYEYIQDESEGFPIVASMSEIAGSASILIAAELLSSPNFGRGVLLGGIAGVPPASVVILGAGTVGEFAARAAIALGAEVKVFDNSIYKLKRLQRNIGAHVFTSIIRQDILTDALIGADVAVGAIHSKSGRTPIIVSEEMVAQMKPGSVIIDVSIDQGGCFETSEITNHRKPIFKKYDVIHYCVPNIASRVPRTASQAISNVITTMLLEASSLGGFEKLMYAHAHIRNGVYMYKGTLTNAHLSERFGMKHNDLNLLFSAGM
ncbi:MAG: alanine dehydrogenase [Chitinophagales bacterium]|nr:alanine dehydrogenase [Chitinophagales bacterium]